MKTLLLNFSVVIILLLAIESCAFAQVGISNDNSPPDNSAMLDVKSTTGGLLIPRMTAAQRNAIVIPAAGLMVYVTDNSCFYYFNGTAWIQIGSGGSANISGTANYLVKFTGATTGGNSQIFDNATNVGVNTSIPAGKFHVKGSSDVSQLIIDANSTQGNTSPLIRLRNSSGNDLMWLHSDDGSNTFVGLNAGRVNNATGGGINNTFSGRDAGYSSITGYSNTAYGYQSLYSNYSGNYNTAAGYQSLYSNTTGSDNTAFGDAALLFNTSGTRNTATGLGALFSNTTGSYNTANGYAACFSNVAGSNATAVGCYAMRYSNNIATAFTNYNVAVGYEALRGSSTASANTGNYNTALGYQVLWSNTSGDHNTANGYNALYSNTTGNSNTANGKNSLFSNTTGNSNTATGFQSLFSNISGFNNSAVGYSALSSNTTGNSNTANGHYALISNTIGNGNTANGRRALFSNTAACQNIAFGYNALYSQSYDNGGTVWNSDNVAIGYEALYSNQPTETYNGIQNTSVGNYALYTNSIGYENTANGTYALYSNTTGSWNTANGYGALHFNTTGERNTAIGYHAGMDCPDNSSCTFLGYYANNNSLINGRFNSTALGNHSFISANHQVRIGDDQVSSIGGYVNWTNLSDGRFKKNISEDVPGLAFITQLRPVTYHLDVTSLNRNLNKNKPSTLREGELPKEETPEEIAGIEAKEKIIYTGFIAQEVEAAARKIGFDFSGVDAPKNEKDFYGLRYAEFVVPLVKAVQEQQQQISELQKTIEDMQSIVQGQQEKIASLIEKMNK